MLENCFLQFSWNLSYFFNPNGFLSFSFSFPKCFMKQKSLTHPTGKSYLTFLISILTTFHFLTKKCFLVKNFFKQFIPVKSIDQQLSTGVSFVSISCFVVLLFHFKILAPKFWDFQITVGADHRMDQKFKCALKNEEEADQCKRHIIREV